MIKVNISFGYPRWIKIEPITIGARDKIKSFILVFSNENILSEQELEANYRNEKKSNMFYTFQYKGNFYKMRNTYAKEFKTGYVTWKENKFFGGGIKSFITNCSKAKIPNCVNHPHNYYLPRAH